VIERIAIAPAQQVMVGDVLFTYSEADTPAEVEAPKSAVEAEARVAAITRLGGGAGVRSSASLAAAADPAADALAKSLADNAPLAEVKSAMARVRQARKAKQAELEQAQADLRKVLTSRQEAIATLNGLL